MAMVLSWRSLIHLSTWHRQVKTMRPPMWNALGRGSSSSRRNLGTNVTSSLSERKIRQGSERLIGQEWAARSESGCTFGSAGDVPSLVFRASSQLTRRSVGAQHMQSFEIEGQTDQTPLSGGGLPAA